MSLCEPGARVTLSESFTENYTFYISSLFRGTGPKVPHGRYFPVAGDTALTVENRDENDSYFRAITFDESD